MKASLEGVVHAGSLAFTAFWLVATSAPDDGPCYSGVPSAGFAELVLGGSTAPPASAGQVPVDDAGPSSASCRGLDGLGPGSRVVFSVLQEGNGRCGYIVTTDVEGTTDVTHSRAGLEGRPLVAAGTFESTRDEAVRCRGTWSLELVAADGSNPFGNIAIAASSGQLLVVRRMSLPFAGHCPGFSPGAVHCEDMFAIDSFEVFE